MPNSRNPDEEAGQLRKVFEELHLVKSTQS